MEARLLSDKKPVDKPLWQQRLLLAESPLTLITPSSAKRKVVENFIAERFLQIYGAKLQHFLPFLLTSIQSESVNSALGFQPAAAQPLFLEQYLNKPIELSLPENAGQIDRQQIVEIGNLAASFQAGSPLLFIVVAAMLEAAGFRYVVFTATGEVRKLLQKLQLTTDLLGLAEPTLLADKGLSWGHYYQHQPVILGGSLPDAVRHLQQHKVIQSALAHHAQFIADTAESVRLS